MLWPQLQRFGQPFSSNRSTWKRSNSWAYLPCLLVELFHFVQITIFWSRVRTIPGKCSLPCVTPSHSCPNQFNEYYTRQNGLASAEVTPEKAHRLLVWALQRVVDMFNPMFWVTDRTGTQNFCVPSGYSWDRGMSHYLLFLISVKADLSLARHSEKDLATAHLDQTTKSSRDSIQCRHQPLTPFAGWLRQSPTPHAGFHKPSSKPPFPHAFCKEPRHLPHRFFLIPPGSRTHKNEMMQHQAEVPLMNIALGAQQDVTGGRTGEPSRRMRSRNEQLQSILLILNSKLIMHKPNKQRSSLTDLQCAFSKGG